MSSHPDTPIGTSGRYNESYNNTQNTDDRFLRILGNRVREARARRGMTRRILAKDSGVSERYLAELESGQGNMSILLLRDVARALDLPLEVLVVEGPDPSLDLIHTVEFLRRLPMEELLEARQILLWRFGGVATTARCGRIALDRAARGRKINPRSKAGGDLQAAFF